jgi:hypothetical protein
MVAAEMKTSLALAGVVLVVLAVLAGACGPPDNSAKLPGTLPTSPQVLPSGDLTVEQATEIIGLPLPVPEYLPPGYAISSVRVKNASSKIAPYWHVEITITSAASPQPMTLSIAGFSLGMKLPPGVETVMIGASRAWVRRAADGTGLTWTDKAGRQLSLQAGTDIQFDDLVKIAQSVSSPPVRAIEVTGPEETPLLVLRGTSGDIAIHLRNESVKNVEISFALDNNFSNIPSGISVSISKESFTLAGEQDADVKVRVSVSADAPAPTFASLPASSILSTNPPPPLSGGQTEPPSYFLSFLIMSHYPAAGLTIEQRDSFSRQLRIDPPPPVPSGLVSLPEAQADVSFPIAMLLPAYLPVGTDPPPLGYRISEQEPNVVTAFYTSFSVKLSAEPGVKDAPSGFAGQRDTIRNRPVVIGSNRIDWWADDIHRTVTSDSLPMSDLRLVAESMMLIGVYSGSWIGMK